jgi:hypothetical protein
MANAVMGRGPSLCRLGGYHGVVPSRICQRGVTTGPQLYVARSGYLYCNDIAVDSCVNIMADWRWGSRAAAFVCSFEPVCAAF